MKRLPRRTDFLAIFKIINKILHINSKTILTNGTHSVIFTYEKEVIIWILIIRL